MSTANKPATPLPWHAIGDGRTIVNDSASEVCFPIGPASKREPNTAYIAHAANAYPKLVRALRLSAYSSDGLIVNGTADALLRELGEAE